MIPRRWKVRKQVCLELGLCLTAFLLAWGFDQFILKTPVLTPFGEKPALTPLYAFWIPRIGWTAWVFPLFCVFFVVFAARFADAKRTGRGKFLLFLAVSSLALPLGLFLIRRPVNQLGFQFNIYPGEEFIFDAIRIQNLGDFLRGYVELMPRLSLHGKHFPPGHATFLYIVQQFFGKSLLVAGMAVLAAFSSGILMCYGAFKTLLNESAARWGALLLLASPSLLDFACTSMDAVFFAFAALALWLSFSAFCGTRSIVLSAAAGAALALAAFFSFSAIPLGFFLLLFCVFNYRRKGIAILVQLASGMAGGIGFVGLVFLGTGFSLLSCFSAAIPLNQEFMASILGRAPLELYPFISFGNASAFLIGTGLAVVGSALLRIVHGQFKGDRLLPAFLLTLAAMVFGGVYVMETERIWLFAIPWLAMAAAGSGRILHQAGPALLTAGLAQALIMELILFTLW